MRNALREPLLHFVVLGLLLFLYFEWRGGASASSRIVVTPGQIAHLASGFARTWQRPPTEEELKGLIDEYVKEEIATREAVASGLDRDDVIIRRRLRQKLEFLVEDSADQSTPDDADLQRWLDANPDAFRAEPQVALRQVFVSRERRGASAAREAERLLARLRAVGPEADTSRLGDPTALPAELQLGPVREVTLTFGDAFGRAVQAVAAGEWTGPVESTYGLHLVFVRERVAASRPDLASIRPQVGREVMTERRRRELDALYQRLLTKYAVTIERPASPQETAVAGAGVAR
jgi:PPIC-type PPIASE domain